MITVVTLNILNDLAAWDRRAPLIVDGLRRMQPDLVALQEVALPHNNAQWLADQLDGYSVHLCPKTGRMAGREALAILSRLPVQQHDTLSLITQSRVAQRLIVAQGASRLAFVNTHLYWNPLDDAPRLGQARKILEWLPEDMPAVVCGDFNAEPHSKTIAALSERFVSAHRAANGREPAYTCPTPLPRHDGIHHRADHVIAWLAGLFLKRKHDSWRGTLDYIFVEPSLRVTSCRVVFDRPAPGDGQLYPSDHFGLMAETQLEST